MTRWGRIDQARRELAAVLGKDVSVEKLAELIGLAGPSLWGWKQGSRPKESSVEALEKILLGAGLARFTRHYIDYGPESAIPETRYRDGLQQAAGEATVTARVEGELEAEQGNRRAPVAKTTFAPSYEEERAAAKKKNQPKKRRARGAE